MANLNSWQKLTRVIPGRPFGDGRDGNVTISGNTTQSLTVKSCSGSATSSTLTIGSSGFTNGDVVLIHQSRGTGVGQWEINTISSGGGSTTLTMQTALQYTYTDSGASQAQVMKIPMYSNATINTGITWSGTDWNQDTGGIFVIGVSNTLTVTGTIENAGGNGSGSTSNHAGAGTGGGYYGGYNVTTPTGGAQQGEGTAGAGAESGSRNANGGGGCPQAVGIEPGGGGGHGTAGDAYSAQEGGTTAGSADLVTLVFGGGGGGARNDTGSGAGGGGAGGGVVAIFAQNITVTGATSANGGNGGSSGVSGSAGAGGAVLLVCRTATLGSSLVYANGGTTGANGGAGRIAIHHSGTVTGTTSPTFTDVTDTSLVETLGGSFLLNLI